MASVVFELVRLTFNVINFVFLAYIVMSWLTAFGIVSPSNPNVRQVSNLLERFVNPILDPIRRVIPPINGLDFSPIIAFLLLGYVIQPLVYKILIAVYYPGQG